MTCYSNKPVLRGRQGRNTDGARRGRLWLQCLDESSRQLVAHSRAPLPARPGDPATWGYEYVRNCVADVFMRFAPPLCERHARVARTRTRRDLAETLYESPTLRWRLI